MSELTKRIITAIVGIAIFMLGMLYNQLTYLLLFLLISSLTLFEYLDVFNKKSYNFSKVPALALNCFAFLISAGFLGSSLQLQLGVFCVLFSTMLLLSLFKNEQKPFINFAIQISGLIYITLPFILTQLIDHHEKSLIVFGVFLLFWTNDTMAYFVGKSKGKNKLLERISPKKTWEGFTGGIIFTLIIATLLSYTLHIYSLPVWIACALIASIIGTMGDLVESMLKRSLEIKDSSAILPGHGGFLDRFDSFMIGFPFIYLLLHLVH